MKDLFKRKDFESTMHSSSSASTAAYGAAREANTKLNKLIESWPVVYGHRDHGFDSHFWYRIKGISHTHTARLAFIEELPKEPVFQAPKGKYRIMWGLNGSDCKSRDATPEECELLDKGASIDVVLKEPCKHEPLQYDLKSFITHGLVLGPKTTDEVLVATTFANKCRHCGVELKATWSEVK